MSNRVSLSGLIRVDMDNSGSLLGLIREDLGIIEPEMISDELGVEDTDVDETDYIKEIDDPIDRVRLRAREMWGRDFKYHLAEALYDVATTLEELRGKS